MSNRNDKRVLVFGTFDLLHEGHRYFLNEARRFGKTLIAVIARDDFVLRRKGHLPAAPMDERIRILEDADLVDEIFPADESIGSYHILRTALPDIICLGYDQKELKSNLEAWLEEHHKPLEIHVLPPFREDVYKTTLLRRKDRQ